MKKASKVKSNINSNMKVKKPNKRNIESRNKRTALSVLLSVMFTCLLFCTVIVGFLTAIYFNLGNIGYKTMNYLQQNDSIYLAEQAAVNEKKNALDRKEKELKKLEDQLNSKERDINAKEKDLKKKEDKLKQDQQEVEELKIALNGQITSLEDVVKLYKNMDVKKAADLLIRQENEEMTLKILKAMNSDLAASILSNMDPDVAASLMVKMIEE